MKKVILASKSKARIDILTASGVNFDYISADIDEEKIKKDGLLKKLSIESIALELARQKSLAISYNNLDKFVIGADQVLECEGQLFSKVNNLDEAYQKLEFLKNKKHYLINGLTIAYNKKIIWEYSNKITMVMRDFSQEFLQNYLKNNQEVLNFVGCYGIEGEGINLFSQIESDYFSILGLPIIPILNFLRENGVILK